MSIIPILSSRQLLSALLKAGLKIIRQNGSHIRLYNPVTKRKTTLSMHAGDLSRKMITGIIKQIGLSIKEFLDILGK